MRNLYCLVGILTVLVGCQATRPSTHLSEAKKITAEFKTTHYVNPPRTSSDILSLFGKNHPNPPTRAVCTQKREELEQRMQRIVNRVGTGTNKKEIDERAANVLEAAAFEFSRGNYANTVSYIEKAIDSLPVRYHTVRENAFRAQLALVQSVIGDLEEASSNQSRVRSLWFEISNSTWYNTDKRGPQMRRLFTSLADGAVFQAEGDLPKAEYEFHRALDQFNKMPPNDNWHIDTSLVNSLLITNLLSQSRPVEAEIMARNAIKALFNNPYGGWDQSKNFWRDRELTNRALLVAQYADVLFQQNRLEESLSFARIAVQMQDVGCAYAGSLGSMRVRQIYMRILAANEDWPEIIRQSRIVETAMGGDKVGFDQLLGNNLDLAMAYVHTGESERGLIMLKQSQSNVEASGGADSYSMAEHRGLFALAKARAGDTGNALDHFSKSIPNLIAKSEDAKLLDGGTASQHRQKQIMSGYMDLLFSLTQSGTPVPGNLDPVKEMFRLAAVQNSGTVQKAVSASARRSAATNPELADLVRREQDAVQEMEIVLSSLLLQETADRATVDHGLRSTLKGRLKQLNAAKLALTKEIAEKYPDFNSLTSRSYRSYDQLISAIQPRQTLISYVVEKDRTFVWAIGHNKEPELTEIKLPRHRVADMVRSLRSAVDPGPLQTLDDIPQFDVQLAQELYQHLLKPVETTFEDSTELLVVATGPLGQLPFSMLVRKPVALAQDKELLFDRYRNVHWLAKDVSVTNLTSVGSLNAFASPTTAGDIAGRRSFVGFGDPFFSPSQALAARSETTEVTTRGITLRNVPKTRQVDSASLSMLPRLPDTRHEILSIAKALGADPARDIFLGERASEPNARNANLSDYRVISFATHGLVSGDLNGLNQPALALTSPDVSTGITGDGLLTMTEIFGLKLNADIAVLSACNTAAAGGEGAEAISGLGRAFFYAGARSLLVSNWPVHSGATTNLMSHLFTALGNDPSLSRATALNQTQLYQIESGVHKDSKNKALFSYAHPIFWAPFSLIGNGG